MKVVSVVGARPQFIKAAPMSRALRNVMHEVLVHTGQHYDADMSDVFFNELELPLPDVNLEVGSGAHGAQTGLIMFRLEEFLLSQSADWVVIYGDTNSTLAAALVAAKLRIKVAHVEAGLRSFNRDMPEEINRVVADHLSHLLLCPSQTAAKNLEAEGVTAGVHVVGDIMADALRLAEERAQQRSAVLSHHGVVQGGYLLATMHRAENTDNHHRLRAILEALNEIREPIIFPVHPRTLKAIQALSFTLAPHVHVTAPLGYLDMVTLERSARMLLTDSGGMQKEAYWLGVPCVTLRDETEWVETVANDWNVLTGADTERILQAVNNFAPPNHRPPLYGDGQTATRCVDLLRQV